MIIKGGAAGNVGFWSKHLQRDDTNSRADIVEISGLLATNLPDALREMEAIAAQSRSAGNFMYQANINPGINERLTPAQWKEAIDTLEKQLGLSGHQRVVVEHEKDGREHRHVIWNRVDVDTLRVTDIGGNYYAHERAARTIELKLDLRKTASLHGEHRPEGRPERPEELWQHRAAERSGIDPKQITAEITDLWRKTDSAKAFVAAIIERCYILAQGDRRTYCIVDQAGNADSLARRIEGVKVKELRERLADIPPASLPTVGEARAEQRRKYPTQEAAREAWEGRTGREATQAPTQERPATDERKPPSEGQSTRPEAQPENAPRQEQPRPKEPERPPADDRTPPREVWHARAATALEERIFRIQDSAERGGVPVTAGLHAEGITLARVDEAGKVQHAYDQRYNPGQEAIKGEVRLMRDGFDEGELVAVTRAGEVERINPRFIDVQRLEQSACGNSPAPPLSTALEFFATDRAEDREQKAGAIREFSEQRQERADFRAAAREATADARATQREHAEAAQDIKGAVFEVKDAATGAVYSLSHFVDRLLSLAGGGPRLTEGDMIVRQRRAEAAMDNLRESFERGDRLNASDLQNLTPTHLENLKMRGDSYMRELLESIERGGPSRQYDYSRSRDM